SFLRIDIDSRHSRRMAAALCHHQANQAAAGSDVKDCLRIPNVGPCPNKYGICPDLHRAVFIADRELFKVKKSRPFHIFASGHRRGALKLVYKHDKSKVGYTWM